MSQVSFFKDEIEKIQDSKLREFAVDVLSLVEEEPYQGKKYVEYVKKVVEYSTVMCEALDVDDLAHDLFVVASLLHHCRLYDLDGEHDPLHALKVRSFASKCMGSLDRDLFDEIMRVIEAHGGLWSPIPQVQPRIEDPPHMWVLPFAVELTGRESLK
jgi:hypothetical protein